MASATGTTRIGSPVNTRTLIACVDYNDDRPLSPFPYDGDSEGDVDQPGESENNNKAFSVITTRHPLIVSLDLDDQGCEPLSRFHSPESLPPSSPLPVDDAPLNLEPTSVVTFTPSLVNDTRAGAFCSREHSACGGSIVVINIDIDSPIPTFDNPELSSSDEGVDSKSAPVSGTQPRSPLSHQSTSPKPVTAICNDHRSTSTNPAVPILSTSSVHRPTSPECSPIIPPQRQRPVTIFHTTIFTPSFENAELPSPFPSPSLHRDRNVVESSAKQVTVKVDLPLPNVISAELVTPASVPNGAQRSNVAEIGSHTSTDPSVEHLEVTRSGRQHSVGLSHTAPSAPSFQTAKPLSLSPRPPLDRDMSADDSLAKQVTMGVEQPLPRIFSPQSAAISSSGAGARGFNGSAPIVEEHATTTSGRNHPGRLVTTAIFIPSLEDAELPSPFLSPSSPEGLTKGQASKVEARMEVDSDISELTSNKPAVAAIFDDRGTCSNNAEATLDNARASRAVTPFDKHRPARPLSTTIFTPCFEVAELSSPIPSPCFHPARCGDQSSTVGMTMEVDLDPPEHTSSEPISSAMSVDNAEVSPSYAAHPFPRPVASLHRSDDTSHNRTDLTIDIGRRAGLAIVAIDIDIPDGDRLSPFDDSSSGLIYECPSPARDLLSPFDADDKSVFQRRENSNLEDKFSRGEISCEMKSVVKGNTFRPHWKSRWEKFPLKEIRRGQLEAVELRILSQCVEDMNTDETNLIWLTNELLSQRFFLPDVSSPPPSYDHMLSESALTELSTELGPARGHPELALVMMHSKQPRLRREFYTPLPAFMRIAQPSFKDLANPQSPDDMRELVQQSLNLIKRIGEIEKFTQGHFGTCTWTAAD